MDAFALARAQIENVTDRIIEGSDRSLFTETLASAQRDQAAARSKLEQLEAQIAETKLALTAAVERPQREASRILHQQIAQRIERALAKAAPAMRELTEAIGDTPEAAFNLLTAADPQIIRGTFPLASETLSGGVVELLIECIRARGQAIAEGRTEHLIGVTLASRAAMTAQPAFSRKVA